jgi:hypothetical protein
MSEWPAGRPSDPSSPPNRLLKCWGGVIDEDGELVHGWQPAPDTGWSEWPPRPDGIPQRLCHPLGFRERNVAELELRGELGGDDDGVCQVIVDERDDEVYVRVLVHIRDEDDRRNRISRDYLDWPVRVWLDSPLGDRTVIDVDDDEELPLFTPEYLNNVPQPDHGYRRVRRRRRRPPEHP